LAKYERLVTWKTPLLIGRKEEREGGVDQVATP
jgi:hypothetical protein